MRRRAARTVLLVGEGDAEVVFLQHLKRLYVERGSGVAVTIKNARGKGAQHVVQFARRQSANAAYDLVVALFDADTDWNESVRKAAVRAKVQVVVCSPCLESLLLQFHQSTDHERSTQQLKQIFAARFGGAAHEQAVWRHFGINLLEEAKPRVGELRTLLHVLATARWPDSVW